MKDQKENKTSQTRFLEQLSGCKTVHPDCRQKVLLYKGTYYL